MEREIAAKLFATAIETSLLAIIRPEDEELRLKVESTAQEFQEFLDAHPDVYEIFKIWYDSEEEV